MSATTIAAPTPLSWGWMRSPSFDIGFIFGIAALAIVAAWAGVIAPNLFAAILILDLWLLGYHHVVSTYTRLAFDRDSFSANRALVLYLPVAVLACTGTIGAAYGAWALNTIYLYWQWFHYTRQSYGIARIYRRKAGCVDDDPWLNHAVLYLLPLWGILHRSAQAPESFLGVPLATIPVPAFVVDTAAVAAVAAIAAWLWNQYLAWRAGRLSPAYAFYVVSHLAVFAVGYLVIDDITQGWIAINIWHNAQYILLVWMFNNNRFKAGVDPRARLLSWLSQRRNAIAYFAFCFVVSTTLYLTIRSGLEFFGFTALTMTLIAYQTINFHHYIVDSIIWKIRKPALQTHLGLAR